MRNHWVQQKEAKEYILDAKGIDSDVARLMAKAIARGWLKLKDIRETATMFIEDKETRG